MGRVHGPAGAEQPPYNLRLIQGRVERIEAIHRRGGWVGVAELYEGLVQN